MALGLISKRTVDALHASERDQFLWDSGIKGFGVKVTPAGRKVYLFQYRVKGRPTPIRKTIGEHGPITAEKARIEAQRLRGLVAVGGDPVGERRAAEAARERELEQQRTELQRLEELHSRLLVSALAERFLTEHVAVKKPRSLRFYEPIVRLHISPSIGNIPMPLLVRDDIDRMLECIPAAQTVNRRNTFMAAARIWNWASKRVSLPEVSPFDQIDPPEKPKSRERVLTDDELVTVWNATSALQWPYGPWYRMLAVTGQRRDEVAGMDWSELNRSLGVWSLSGSRVKNSKTHLVALSPFAVQMLDDLAGSDEWPKSGLVFTATGRTPVSGFSAAKRKLDAEIAKTTEIPSWRLHDLRRTMATGYQRLGVRMEVTEAALNHISGSRAGVAGIYGRHDWYIEKISAARLWSAHVQAILAGFREGHISKSDSNSMPDAVKGAEEWRSFVTGWAERNGPPRDNVAELPVRNRGTVS